MSDDHAVEPFDDITLIDCHLHRPGIAACYLLGAGGEYALIDCGTANSVPHILAVLREKQIAPRRIRYLIPTHVHLDHAGGAGYLMDVLPNAQLLVHERGLPHVIDPQRLQQSAVSVYGEAEFNRVFGALRPVPPSRARAVHDGEQLDLNGRTLTLIDSPGHARHHLCVFDAVSRGWFTGDTFGLAYPHLHGRAGSFILPTTTPTQFDPQGWATTLDRLLSFAPRRMYLTHFGPLGDVASMAAMLQRGIGEYVSIATQGAQKPDRQRWLQQVLMQHALDVLHELEHAADDDQLRQWLRMDIELNAQGLDHWLDRRA